MAELRRAGHPVPFADSWFAAAALHLNLALVTHNPRDFHGITGLVVISEAPPAP